IRPLRAQLLRGDFWRLRLAGPSTATGRPRRVMVIGSPDCSISPRQAKHLALNSEALKTRSFMIFMIAERYGHLTNFRGGGRAPEPDDNLSNAPRPAIRGSLR